MSVARKPIYLFADSQPLFWRDRGELFLLSIRQQIVHNPARAAYIGASNGDDPQFYSIFESAMVAVGIEQCRMIPSNPSHEDELFLTNADLILLAGGDVARGWKVFSTNGFNEIVPQKYDEGSLLIGISAGAVQLGLGFVESGGNSHQLIETFKLVPFMIGVHEEKQQWQSLMATVRRLKDNARAIGIPGGAGLVFHQDHGIQPIRYSLTEFSIQNGEVTRRPLDVKQP